LEILVLVSEPSDQDSVALHATNGIFDKAANLAPHRHPHRRTGYLQRVGADGWQGCATNCEKL